MSHLLHASAAQRLGEVDSAVKSYKKALKLEPTNAAALVNLGVVLKSSNQIDEAFKYFRLASERAPRVAEG